MTDITQDARIAAERFNCDLLVRLTGTQLNNLAGILSAHAATARKEALEEAAKIAEASADQSNAAFAAGAGGDEGKDRNTARYRTALRIAQAIRQSIERGE